MSAHPSIRIEGGLFGLDLLDQIISAGLAGQKPADFGLEPRRNMTDEIAAVFADARALWGVFQNRLDRLPDLPDPATTVTRDSWMIPFFALLGFELRFNPKAYEADGLSFAISHRAGEAEDSPPVHIVGARQELGRVAASGRPRLAPHSLLQEFLNRTEHVWGIVSNGKVLRLLRDSTYVRRQAYVEFDLEAIFEEQRFLDFAALYRLLHRTRFPRGMTDGADCLLEKYHAISVEQGGRVREHMRDGVEECIRILADGFLGHPSNEGLRDEIGTGCLTAPALYKQFLKLVYRLIFLLVAEDRGLVSLDAAYREHYGIGRLRRLLEIRSSFSDHTDLWMGLRVLWRVLGDEKLALLLSLAPLNGELFAPVDLDGYLISNKDLLGAFWHLANYRESLSGSVRRVNYTALDVEELGSVYESLLEFHPVVETDATGRPNFRLASGSERKTTGSYYTPPELVNELIQSALVPVFNERLQAATSATEKEKAILGLKVCDPACGSGHFLLAAARRLGKELARARTGEEEPSPERFRDCVRDVIAHCIYGVDKNPLAVDLCRVALWIEGHTEGKPLTFLDHRILCGDSLVGVFNLAALKEGIPDQAFKPLEGDDKEAAREALRKNKFEKRGEPRLFGWDPQAGLSDFYVHCHELEGIADDSPDDVRRKKAVFEAQHRDRAWLRDKTGCDLWTAAFFQKYVPGCPPITTAAVAEILAGGAVDGRLSGQAFALSQLQSFFHWPLEFPEVFAGGGFDVVLSNPPWERIKIQEQEFFAARDKEIADAPNKAMRARLIKDLPGKNPALFNEFVSVLRLSEGASVFLRNSRRFPLAGRGDINTYAVFAEFAGQLTRAGGRSGIIIPSGIATDDTTKYFFQDVIKSGSLVGLFDFENRKKIFASIDSRIKFCLFTCEKPRTKSQKPKTAEFFFFAHEVGDLKDLARRFTLSTEDITLLNPNTETCPIFRSRADAELTKAIYRRISVLHKESGKQSNPWDIDIRQGLFHLTNDSRDGFIVDISEAQVETEKMIPLYEAKFIWQYDHRFASFEPNLNVPSPRHRGLTSGLSGVASHPIAGRYYCSQEVFSDRIPKSYKRKWWLVYRDITNSTNERTCIAAIIPFLPIAYTLRVFTHIGAERSTKEILCLLSNLNSFMFDYVTRQFVGGTHLSDHIMKQLPVLMPENYGKADVESISDKVIELTYTSPELRELANDFGYFGRVFDTNEDRRFALRCELDAEFFHLYLPSDAKGDWVQAENETADQLAELKRHFPTPRVAVSHILDQFPIVREKEERRFGRFRTKERILDAYAVLIA